MNTSTDPTTEIFVVYSALSTGITRSHQFLEVIVIDIA